MFFVLLMGRLFLQQLVKGHSNIEQHGFLFLFPFTIYFHLAFLKKKVIKREEKIKEDLVLPK